MSKIKIPHVFILLTIIIFSLLSYIIPSGKYETKIIKLKDGGRKTVIPKTDSELHKNYTWQGLFIEEPNTKNGVTPISLMAFLSIVPDGMGKAANIIFFIFLVGGVFEILDKTGTIVTIINKILKYFKKSYVLLTVISVLLIGIGGSTIGMGEKLISLVPIFILVASKLGLDKIYGLAILYLSGQAAITMPLMAPLADILGVSRQTAVFAFTCGDGFSNTIFPTAGILMAMISITKIPYSKWLKFMLPLFLLLSLVSIIFLIIAVYIGY